MSARSGPARRSPATGWSRSSAAAAWASSIARRDLSLQRPVALKLIAPELAEDERFRSRFLKEPRLAASLDHPNVVPIYEAGERDGQLYLAMRYVEGSDLKTLLQRDGPLGAERALAHPRRRSRARWTRRTGAGSSTATSSRRNILVDEDGHAYLTDFGVSKQARAASTDTGRMVGHARLPGARADPRRGGRRAHRRLRAGLRALRVPRRRAAVPSRDARPRRCGRTCRRSRSASRPPGARPRAAAGARQGARRALRKLRRADRGGRRGARARSAAAAARACPAARCAAAGDPGRRAARARAAPPPP